MSDKRITLIDTILDSYKIVNGIKPQRCDFDGMFQEELVSLAVRLSNAKQRLDEYNLKRRDELVEAEMDPTAFIVHVDNLEDDGEYEYDPSVIIWRNTAPPSNTAIADAIKQGINGDGGD